MKPRFSLLAAALVSVFITSPAKAGTVELFHETFDSNDQNWSYTSSGQPVFDKSWSIVDGSVYPGYKGVKLGTTTVEAHLKTTVVNPINRVGDIFITVCAAAYTNSAGTQYVKVDVVDSSDTFIVSLGGQANGASLPKHSSSGKVEIPFTGDFVKTFTLSSEVIPASGGIALVFTSETSNQQQKRLLLGDVLVEQIIPPLSAPANLDISGTVGANDFAVTWSSVSNAEGYSVKLLDANDGVVSSNDVAAATTTSSFTGLVSSSVYTVVIVALGNHTTTDDSAPKTLEVETAASTATAPTLVVANTSWTAGVAGTSAVSATLEGNIACTVESVSMSDGSSATVSNGTLSWTPPASNLASSVTATFHVSHDMDGWDIAQVLSVAATPAPSAPVIDFASISRRSFNATWSSSAGGPVVSYKVRAWTGRATPDDATGGADEMFTDWYNQLQVLPKGWTKEGSPGRYAVEGAPIAFNKSNQSLESPVYPGTIDTLSFHLRQYSGDTSKPSSFSAFASTGESGAEWILIRSINISTEVGTSGTTPFSLSVPANTHKFRFEYVKDAGNVGFGTFSVSGTDWPAADFLAGWGGAKVSVGSATSQTFSNPVAGTANYVEVTAIGPTGLATSAIRSVDIPHAPGGVISVK